MSNAPRVLVVEDEPAVLRALLVALESQGYAAIAAASGTQGVAKAASEGPTVMLLDLGLPDLDGLEVIRRVRTFAPDMPLIVLSAHGEDRTKVEALDLGADDFVTKPFAMPELLARVRAGLRRAQRIAARESSPSAALAHSEIRIDAGAQRVWVRGGEVHLTPTQFRVLLVLAANPGRVLSHSAIVREAWGDPTAADSANLRVVIGQLRRAIEKDHRRPCLLVTLPGVGYRLDDPAG
jgi:two-component system KDP operon response regulator KdpE